jgi:hypothetical protein
MNLSFPEREFSRGQAKIYGKGIGALLMNGLLSFPQ